MLEALQGEVEEKDYTIGQGALGLSIAGFTRAVSRQIQYCMEVLADIEQWWTKCLGKKDFKNMVSV